jgi:hypothetical protein
MLLLFIFRVVLISRIVIVIRILVYVVEGKLDDVSGGGVLGRVGEAVRKRD